MTYLRQFSTRQTPQSQPIPGTSQTENSAGGFVWSVDCWTRLHRFLILGSEGGTYYISEAKLTTENAGAVTECLLADGARTVREIVAVSAAGRAPKNDPAIFALAMAASIGALDGAPNDPREAEWTATRKAALDALPEVCRTGTHLFHFAAYVEQFRGWGRALRRAVGEWYTAKDLDDLAYQVVKYRQRDGWNHRDLLRLAHPTSSDLHQNTLLQWIVGDAYIADGFLPKAVHAYEAAQATSTPVATAKLVRSCGKRLPREALNPDHLTDPGVWEALLEVGMPMTALIRNLATMTRVGLLVPGSSAVRTVVRQIANTPAILAARVHPIAVLAAQLTYASGHSARGGHTWSPVVQVVDALDAAFYASFGNVEATGKRWLLALDVSGSMNSDWVADVPGLTPRVASSAMAMVTAATGDPYEVVGFTSRGGWWGNASLTSLPLSPRQRLDDICRLTNGLPFGGTDCSLPMMYAIQEKREFDVFAVYTDSETWHGDIHPSQALVRYRQQSGINAKLVVVGMVSNGFSIADPNDLGMLDCVGFDTSTPSVIADFATS